MSSCVLNMNRSTNQSCFLRRLLRYEGSAVSRELCERLESVERNERSLLCACRLVGLIALLGYAGIGYGAVLLPQFFDNSTHVVMRLSGGVGLGSTGCLLVFLALWFSCRFTARRIRAQCRSVVDKMLAERLPGFAAVVDGTVVKEGPRLSVELPRRGGESPLSVGTDTLAEQRVP